MHDQFQQLRLQVLRRVTYATNAVALQDDRLPPDGPFDAALTNGLLAIVAAELPGEDLDGKFTRPASGLLGVLENAPDVAPFVEINALREGLQLTQPYRHGRADDEWSHLRRPHINAVLALDQHHSLSFLQKAAGRRTVSDLVRLAFEERTSEFLPLALKERLKVPGLEDCEECWRPTFLPSGWDEFGGTMTQGRCVACGYKRTAETAEQIAWDEELRRAIER